MTSTEMNEMPERASTAELPRVARRTESVSRSSAADMVDAWGEARSRDLKRSPYPRVLGTVLRHASRVQVAAWDRALRDVRRVQEEQLPMPSLVLIDGGLGQLHAAAAHVFLHIRGGSP